MSVEIKSAHIAKLEDQMKESEKDHEKVEVKVKQTKEIKDVFIHKLEG